MSNVSWEQSVEKARLASLKTFQGRIEMVLASWEQIPRKSESGNGKLARFALDAGIEYQTLKNARSVCDWLLPARIGTDIGTDLVAAIGSWSLAAEARRNHEEWKDGKALAAFLLKTDPPEGFSRWTVDALRIHQEKKPTNTGKLALQAIAGVTVTEDAQHAAAAKDAMDEVATEVEQIKNRRVRDETVIEVIDAAIDLPHEREPLEVPRLDPDTLALRELPSRISLHKRVLIDLLEQAPRFLERFGQEQVERDDHTYLASDLLMETIEQVKGEVTLACDKQTGNLDSALSEILANN